MWASVGIFLALLVLPMLLWVPAVQDAAQRAACSYAKRNYGIDITIDRLLIKFPLDVSLDNVRVLGEHADTMARVGSFEAGIEVLPLLQLDVKLGTARLMRGLYEMTSADSSMMLSADIDFAQIKGADVDLKHNVVNLLDAEVRGGRILYGGYPHKKVEELDTAASTPWLVQAARISVTDIDFTMRMLPTVDKLRAHVAQAQLLGGRVHTGDHTVQVGTLTADSADVRYYTLDTKQAALYSKLHPLPPDTLPWQPSDTVTWLVRADSVRLGNSHVLYATSGHTPVPGLDSEHIELTGANVALTQLVNRGTMVQATLAELSLKERSGLVVRSGVGTFYYDSTRIDAGNVRLKTQHSDLFVDAHLPMTLIGTPPSGQFSLTTRSSIALHEIATLMPSLKGTLAQVPQRSPLQVQGQFAGTPSRVTFKNALAAIPGYFKATASGVVTNPMDAGKLGGDVDFSAQFTNVDFAKQMALDKETQAMVNIPPLTAKGRVKFSGSNYAGNVDALVAGTGKLVGKGSFRGSGEAYDVDARFSHFPVQRILPQYAVDDLTAHVVASGHGFDFFKPSTAVQASVDLASVTYDKARYSDVQARVSLNGGNLLANVHSGTPGAQVDMVASGQIIGNRYIFDLDGTAHDLDVHRLGFIDVPCAGSGQFTAKVDYDTKTQHSNVSADLSHLNWNYDGSPIVSETTQLSFLSDDRNIKAYLDNEDSHIDFVAPMSLDTFLKTIDKSLAELQRQYKARSLDVDALQAALPKFSLDLKLGPNGIAPRFLAASGIDLREVRAEIRNDSLLYANGYAHQIAFDDIAVDTINFYAAQDASHRLAFNVHMGNRPGTWDEFARVDLQGTAADSTLGFTVAQQNIKGETGYRLGMDATLAGQVVQAHFHESPVIGYRQWEVSANNHLNVNYATRMLDADLKLSTEGSSLAIVTQPSDEPGKEWVDVAVENLKLEEWLGLVPTLDMPLGGTLGANMHLLYDSNNLGIDGTANMKIDGFTYSGFPQGDVGLNTELALDVATKQTRINGVLNWDGSDVALAYGSYDSDEPQNPLDITLKVSSFPLRKVSPYIPGHMIMLGGKMDGEIAVRGSLDNYDINGQVQGDSAIVALPLYGAQLRLDDKPIAVKAGKIAFDNFAMWGYNEHPVIMNGTVDINTMAIDLALRGRNVQVVGQEQRFFSEIFGKGFVDVDASVKSSNDAMLVDADVTLLSGSNITYVLQDEVNDLSSLNTVDRNMVTFVNPNDSVGLGTLGKTDAVSSSSTSIACDINVQQGAKLGVYLSTDGKDRCTIDGSGRLRYTLDFAGKDNMAGTYTIEEGNVRYTPPVISQKEFNISSGSTITWTGDVLNPQLNITGTDRLKASVATDGTSHLVEFLVTAMITNTLSKMDLKFDLSTTSDMTVQNELQAMSDTQRSAAAINLLLYNTYSGTNSAGNINVSGTSALYSFLQSQLNSWASSTLKGFDLSFGISEYESMTDGTSSTQTSYSYRMSKSLFNDRFKVVVGGEYSTDATSEASIADNLLSDISVEYYMNKSGSKYFRLFRHTGWESVLEGEVTELGGAFVMKRKVSDLRHLFRYKSKQRMLQDSLEKAMKLQAKQLKAAEAAGKNAGPTPTDSTTQKQ